jgi:hypothetical protein
LAGLIRDHGRDALHPAEVLLGELPGAVKPEYLPAAVALCERGWLERRWHGDDVVFWFTDTGLAALDMQALHRDDPVDMN